MDLGALRAIRDRDATVARLFLISSSEMMRPCSMIDQQHAAGLEAPFGDDLLFGNRQHAHFRGHDHEAVVGDEIARRTQAVAVERRADLAAVGEGDGGGAVPRLHQRGVIFVEGAALLVHQRIAGPGFRDQHHHGVGHGIAALHQEFERIVETGGVRLAFVGDRPQLGNVVAEQGRGDRSLARRHPVDVAAQRVDLAVMRDHAIGMGELPGREGVGREALMHQRDGGLDALVAQVREIIAELRWRAAGPCRRWCATTARPDTSPASCGSCSA